MTLGHIVALEDDPSLFYEPSNHMPECSPCNSADGARRTNAKRRATRGHAPEPAERLIRSSPHWE